MKRAAYILFFLLPACASVPAYQKGFDIDAYSKIGVMNFIPSSSEANSGHSVSDEFIRQLIKRNKQVIEISQPRDFYTTNYQVLAEKYAVDAIISGTVTRYIPDAKDRVYFKDDEGKIISEVFFDYAEIGISAKLIDAADGQVLWSDTYNYSGFTLDDTLTTVVNAILDRMEQTK